MYKKIFAPILLIIITILVVCAVAVNCGSVESDIINETTQVEESEESITS